MTANMLNQRDMGAADVIRQAVLMSGKPQEEIEALAGLRPGILDQYASRHDQRWPSLLNIPAICQALGNDLLIAWLQAQYESLALRHYPQEISGPELLRETVASAAEFGDVARAVEAALKDEKLTRRERMAIRREAMEHVSRLFGLINGVAERI